MIYNKPRDVKLRVLPTVSTLIKKADNVKGKFTKEAKIDTDKLILPNEAVPENIAGTAQVAVAEKTTTHSASLNREIKDNGDKDFDIILKEPAGVSEPDDIIFDLTMMPVIDGIPMLRLPDEPSFPTPESNHKEIVFADTKDVQPKLHDTNDNSENDDIINLADIPDIEGIPILELKPVDPEKIQLLEDFVYKPVVQTQERSIQIPTRPDTDTAESVAEEALTEEVAEFEKAVEVPVTEKVTDFEEAIEEPVTEEVTESEEAVEESATEEVAELEEAVEVPVTEESADFEEVAKEPVSQDNTEEEKTVSTPAFVKQKSKQGRKTKKKEKQQKNKPEKKEKKNTVATEIKKEAQAAETTPQKKKEKKSKPVITNKRRYFRKKGVRLKLRLISAHESRVQKRKKKGDKFGRTRKLKVASFFLMLYAGTVLAFIIPLRPSYSETEKRQLTEFPEFSVKALASGDYFADIDTWFSDTFPFREILTEADTILKSLYGRDTVTIHGDVDTGDEIPDTPLAVVPEKKPEPQVTEPVTMPDNKELNEDNGDPNAVKPDIEVQSLDAIVVAGDSAYEYYSFSQDVAPRFIDCVNKLDGIVNPTGKVYAMIAPTSTDITLNDALRAEINSANQEKALKYFNASFKNTVAVDGIYEAERLHRDEYTYFRTDHHWTALGAYYAYEQWATEKGIEPIPLTKYKTQRFDNFIGTFYSSSGKKPELKKNPDYVTAYLPFNKVTCTISDSPTYPGFEWNIITDVTEHSAGSKYLTFIGGDNAITTITNLDNPQGESCIVIKDSFGNAFVPFLIPHYSTIYVIDPRHYEGSLSSFCEGKQINDVIFLANISTTRNYIFLDHLENLVK